MQDTYNDLTISTVDFYKEWSDDVLGAIKASKYAQRNPSSSTALQALLELRRVCPEFHGTVDDAIVLMQENSDIAKAVDKQLNIGIYKNDKKLSFHQTKDYNYCPELLGLHSSASHLFRYFETAQSQFGFVKFNRSFVMDTMHLSKNTITEALKQLIDFGFIMEYGTYKNTKIYKVNQDISNKSKFGFKKSSPRLGLNAKYSSIVETIDIKKPLGEVESIRVGTIEAVAIQNTAPKTKTPEPAADTTQTANSDALRNNSNSNFTNILLENQDIDTAMNCKEPK